jgi:hypothetical protein
LTWLCELIKCCLHCKWNNCWSSSVGQQREQDHSDRQVMHRRTGPTCKHFHKLAAHCAEEGDASLASNSTSQVSLAGTRRALKDDTLQHRTQHIRYTTTTTTSQGRDLL